LNCKSFIGCHSSIILGAWFAKTKTACLVPVHHDGGQLFSEFFAHGNQTTWGARQPFNKTFILENDNSVNIKEIVEWLN
jgi:hypothetical protein